MAMGPGPTALLGLVLCLGEAIHRQRGALPKPSIRAEPGPVVSWGQPVIIVCRGPAEADVFRLVGEGRSRNFQDQKVLSQRDTEWTETRFHIPAVSEDSPRHYRCLYRKESSLFGWSDRSEILELKVTAEHVSTPPAAPTSQNYTVGNCVRLGLAGVVLLILVVILAEAGLSQRRLPHGPRG